MESLVVLFLFNIHFYLGKEIFIMLGDNCSYEK